MARKTVTTSELKAHCGEVIDSVARGHGPVLVTRRGKPVATIVPVETGRRRLFGFLRGSVTILGDVVGPIDVEWEAQQ